MNTNVKHIFSTSDEIISQAEIQRYVLGKMSAKEMHEVELLMESNPFVADAIEGYQSFPESIGTANDQPNGSTSGRTTWTWSILGGLLLIGTSYWYFSQPDISSNIPTPEPETNIENNKPNTINDAAIVIIDSHYSDSSIQVTSTRKNTKETTNLITEKFARVEKEKVQEKIEPTAIDPNKIKDSIKAKPIKKEIAISKIYDSYHIVDYTVYDYRGKREEPIKILTPITSGTPANQADKTSIPDNQNQTIQVFYDDYLKEAVVLFSKRNYRQADKRFKTILKKYPEDVNALFYKSMCSFNREKYRQASTEFNKYLSQPITLFDEDAHFFLALSLLETGEKEDALILLKKISKKDGFYKKQADQLLMKNA